MFTRRLVRSEMFVTSGLITEACVQQNVFGIPLETIIVDMYAP